MRSGIMSERYASTYELAMLSFNAQINAILASPEVTGENNIPIVILPINYARALQDVLLRETIRPFSDFPNSPPQTKIRNC